MSSTKVLTASLLAIGLAGVAAPALAQNQGYETFRRQAGQALTNPRPDADASGARRVDSPKTDYYFRSRKDSLDWERWKKVADNAKERFRIVVSLQERHVWVLFDEDTLLSAPAAVASGRTLTYQGFTKTFDMPRGRREVLGKDADPVWVPPIWLYYETADELGLKVKEMPASGLTMPDGRRLFVDSDNEVGVMDSQGPTKFVDKNLHLIFDNVLYVPPVGTENRKVNGTLGKYKLMLGDGYLFHGTPLKNSIGLAATHGCIRLRDEDIEWMYENVPVGTKVYIF